MEIEFKSRHNVARRVQRHWILDYRILNVINNSLNTQKWKKSSKLQYRLENQVLMTYEAAKWCSLGENQKDDWRLSFFVEECWKLDVQRKQYEELKRRCVRIVIWRIHVNKIKTWSINSLHSRNLGYHYVSYIKG